MIDIERINDYVGLPFKEKGREKSGCDCYGLLRILYQDLLGISIPAYDEPEFDLAVYSALIIEKRKEWVEVTEPRFGDAVSLKVTGLSCHVGMMIDSDRFIHSLRGVDSCIDNISSIIWRHRVDGFFRYQG